MTKRKPWRAPGINLWFAMVLFTAIIVWLGLRADRKVKESKIAELKTLVGESSVRDFDAFAVKELDRTSMDFNWMPRNPGAGSTVKDVRRCEIYLPRQGSYEICFAGSGIGMKGFPNPDERFPIESGYRKIELTAEKADVDWKFSLLVDGQTVSSRTFDGGIVFASLFTGYHHHRETNQQPTSQPLELIRNMLGPTTSTTPTGKSLALGDGILIWIQKK